MASVASLLGSRDDWHSVLGVSADAALPDIRKAYLRLVRQTHPDKLHSDSTSGDHAAAAANFCRLQAAYDHAVASRSKPGGAVLAHIRLCPTLSKECRDGNMSEVRRLLAQSAAVNEKDEMGLTPLMFAAKSPRAVDLLRLLLEAGADLGARTCMGWNAVTFAACKGDLQAVRLLLQNGSAVEIDAMTTTSSTGQWEVLQELLTLSNLHGACSANVSTARERKTPLHFALLGICIPKRRECDHKEVVRVLLDAHAQVNSRDVRGRTPLLSLTLHARWLKEQLSGSAVHLEVIEMLLAGGADVTAADRDGATPLAFAEASGDALLWRTLREWA